MSTPNQKLSAVQEDNKSAKVAARASRLSWFLDESIRLPGGFRIGWDGIIGLIPGLGDMMGLAASSYILYLAAQGGVGKVVLVRMALNVLFETALGSIPVIGDLFDFVFKANSRNLQLLQRHAEAPARVRRVSAVWLTVFVLLIVLAIAGIVMAVVKLLEWLLPATY